jgi:cytochrome c oxidase assembly protein subunit 20
MADTQGGEPASQQSPTNKPKHEFPKSQVGKLWEAFGNPEEPINVHPGAKYSPSHEKPKEVSLSESLKSVSLSDFSTFHQKPCARDSLMIGLGTGFGIGGVRGIVGGEIGCAFQSYSLAFI